MCVCIYRVNPLNPNLREHLGLTRAREKEREGKLQGWKERLAQMGCLSIYIYLYLDRFRYRERDGERGRATGLEREARPNGMSVYLYIFIFR